MRSMTTPTDTDASARDHFWAGVVAGCGMTVVGQWAFDAVETLAAYQSAAAVADDVRAALTTETIAVVDLITVVLVGLLIWSLAIAVQYMGGVRL